MVLDSEVCVFFFMFIFSVQHEEIGDLIFVVIFIYPEFTFDIFICRLQPAYLCMYIHIYMCKMYVCGYGSGWNVCCCCTFPHFIEKMALSTVVQTLRQT